MTGPCPKCGWQPVAGAECPRCGVDVARYRLELGTAGASGSVAAPERPAGPAQARPEPSARAAAGFWIRVVAWLIDAVALFAVERALWVLAAAVFAGARPFVIGAAAQSFGVVLWTVYPVIFHWLWGQTLGKMAVQIRVVTVDGRPLSLSCAIIRQLGSWVSAAVFGIGYLMAGLRRDKRALHDLIADTRVERLA